MSKGIDAECACCRCPITWPSEAYGRVRRCDYCRLNCPSVRNGIPNCSAPMKTVVRP